MYDIQSIKNYILYLKNSCGLSVTLHPFKKENLIHASELILFNIHDNSYCVYVKTNEAAHAHCVSRQCRVLDRCASGSFCGTCFAGVKEYVYPIRRQGEVIGFVSVSGYRCENAESYIEKTAARFSMSEESLRAVYTSLKPEMPPKDFVDTLMHPLLSMLELAYMNSKEEIMESFMDSIVRYIRRYHKENIGIDDLCAHFSCSRSKISHAFKARFGKSFREYLTELRLSDAEGLLRYSELSVTEIAYSVGFCDSNYFSGVFKRHYGMAPTEYRKVNKEMWYFARF